MRRARFEVVRTAAGWHARFRASNGAIVWTTESYKRRAQADRAISLVVAATNSLFTVQIRDVDERAHD